MPRTNEETMIQYSVLKELEDMQSECRRHSNCFECPFRRYDMDMNRLTDNNFWSVSELCSLYQALNTIPRAIRLDRLVKLIEEGRK